MSSAPGKLVVHHRSQGVAMGTLDYFFVMRCVGAVSPDDIQATLKCAEVLRAYRPAGSASIVAVDPTSTFPSEETRRAALQVSRETNSQTMALAIIILGDGFWASAIRGVVTTLTSLTPASANHRRKVARHEAEGVDWVLETIGESPHKYRSALLNALTQLKPALSSPSPAARSRPPSSKAPAPSSKSPGATSKPAPSSKSPEAASKPPAPSSKSPEPTSKPPAVSSKVPPSSKRSSG